MQVKEFVIDLFCGAGGTSEGVFLADCDSTVTACVNHDLKAIESHRANHPNAKHFVEDIRNPEVVFFLWLRVRALRKKYPGCIITIWASLECTNFSKAKGGKARDGDSRTLANHLFMYVDMLKPDYLMIENVMEFMAWGAVDRDGKPIASKKGEDYLKWVENMKQRGFNFEHQQINSADVGAYTSRSRFFAQFARYGMPISWPEQTHAKKVSDLSKLKKWKPVKEVLDFSVEGVSIFLRKKPLVENTEKRIYAGLVKFVANGDESFIKKYFSGRPAGKVISVDGPAGTVTTFGGQALVDCNFLLKYNSINKGTGKHVPPSIEDPCPTVATQNRLGLTTAQFLQGYYGNGKVHSLDVPSPTISTKDRYGKVEPIFLTNYYSSGGQLGSIENPCPTIMNVPKQVLTSTHFIFNPQYKSKGSSTQNPCPTIIARQDKAPLSLVVCEMGEGFAIPIYEDDTETMVKIKYFMATYGIVDIKMRMLLINELLRIQGFPDGYQLVGTQTDRKKFIGNSVEVTTAKKLFEAHHDGLKEHFAELRRVA
tara:strand:- start:6583 stop:8199 length:1617 start_codon:yes stop_codon:yes gene_type:complete